MNFILDFSSIQKPVPFANILWATVEISSDKLKQALTCVTCSSFFRRSSSCKRFCCFLDTTSVKPSSFKFDWGSSTTVTSGWSSIITTPTSGKKIYTIFVFFKWKRNVCQVVLKTKKKSQRLSSYIKVQTTSDPVRALKISDLWKKIITKVKNKSPKTICFEWHFCFFLKVNA